MFDAYIYSELYAHCLLILTLLSAVLYMRGYSGLTAAEDYNSVMLWVVSVAVIFFIGTRPISGAFTDMMTYNMIYNHAYVSGESLFPDWAFAKLVTFMSANFSPESFFLVCAALYVIPLFWLRRAHGKWAFAAVLACMGSFSFFAYGVNTIRHGIAASVLIAAFACHRTRWLMFLLIAVAFGMHKSMLAPAVAFLAASIISSPWLAWAVWAVALGASITIGQALSNYITSISFFASEDKFIGYAQGVGQDKGGFRWDFIFYSIVPVAASFLLARPEVRRDSLYRRLLGTFLLTNAFWLCVIYAAYSDRFAYLSWFIMPWLITYPFLPRLEPTDGATWGAREYRLGWLAATLVIHYSFTYFMKMVYYRDYIY